MEDNSTTKEGSYIGLTISKASSDALKKLQDHLGINEEFPFHITIVYSREKIEIELNPEINQIIKAEKFHIFDNTATIGERALIIKFHCPYCEQRHNYAEVVHGATFDYPTYETHVTLAYQWDSELPDNELLKDLNIEIKSEYYEPLYLEWAKTQVKRT